MENSVAMVLAGLVVAAELQNGDTTDDHDDGAEQCSDNSPVSEGHEIGHGLLPGCETGAGQGSDEGHRDG